MKKFIFKAIIALTLLPNCFQAAFGETIELTPDDPEKALSEIKSYLSYSKPSSLFLKNGETTYQFPGCFDGDSACHADGIRKALIKRADHVEPAYFEYLEDSVEIVIPTGSIDDYACSGLPTLRIHFDTYDG